MVEWPWITPRGGMIERFGRSYAVAGSRREGYYFAPLEAPEMQRFFDALFRYQAKVAPRIAERSGGRFDEAAVMQVIDGRREVAAHGPREMPVWGAVFADELGEERWGFYTAMLHARALTDYLRSIQRDR